MSKSSVKRKQNRMTFWTKSDEMVHFRKSAPTPMDSPFLATRATSEIDQKTGESDRFHFGRHLYKNLVHVCKIQLPEHACSPCLFHLSVSQKTYKKHLSFGGGRTDGRTDGDECRSAGLPSMRNLISEKFSVRYGTLFHLHSNLVNP